MLEIRKQRERNEVRKREYEQRLRYENQQKHNEILIQKQLAEQRKREIEEQKRRFFKMEYEKRLKEEVAAKNKRELEVLEMEKLEMELINKLQQTQSIQKSAYEELETALANSPDEFERRYPIRVLNKGRPQKSGSRGSFSVNHGEHSKRDLSIVDDNKNNASQQQITTINPDAIHHSPQEGPQNGQEGPQDGQKDQQGGQMDNSKILPEQ